MVPREGCSGSLLLWNRTAGSLARARKKLTTSGPNTSSIVWVDRREASERVRKFASEGGANGSSRERLPGKKSERPFEPRRSIHHFRHQPRRRAMISGDPPAILDSSGFPFRGGGSLMSGSVANVHHFNGSCPVATNGLATRTRPVCRSLCILRRANARRIRQLLRIPRPLLSRSVCSSSARRSPSS